MEPQPEQWTVVVLNGSKEEEFCSDWHPQYGQILQGQTASSWFFEWQDEGVTVARIWRKCVLETVVRYFNYNILSRRFVWLDEWIQGTQMQYGSLTTASVMVVFVDIDMYRLVVENQSFFCLFFFDTHAACDKYGPDSRERFLSDQKSLAP